jgi:uncharacterized protein (DUF1330 family)
VAHTAFAAYQRHRGAHGCSRARARIESREEQYREVSMAKGYWVVTYRSIKNAGADEAYVKRAVPALQAVGGRFVVRGMPTKIYEAGMNERVAVIEFDDIAKAVAAHDAAEYQTALKLLGDGADRDIRIVEGAA